MLDSKLFDDLAKRLAEVIPPGVKNLQHEIEKNFRVVLQSFFAKLDLVTRDEFDAQVRVLTRTRAKLEALENQLAEMKGKQGHKKTTKKDDQ